jgi:hypothetical protein
VKLKAIHLLHRLERIDRDLEELQQMQNSIQEDRAYARTLKESLMEEFSRLRQFKSRILSQIIHNPPAGMIGEEISALHTVNSEIKTIISKKPEVIIPEAIRNVPEKQGTPAYSTDHPPQVIPVPESTAETHRPKETAPVLTKEPPQKKPSFRFVYDNKSNQ